MEFETTNLPFFSNLDCVRVEILRVEEKVESVGADAALRRHRRGQVVVVVVVRVDHVIWKVSEGVVQGSQLVALSRFHTFLSGSQSQEQDLNLEITRPPY